MDYSTPIASFERGVTVVFFYKEKTVWGGAVLDLSDLLVVRVAFPSLNGTSRPNKVVMRSSSKAYIVRYDRGAFF